MTATAKLSEQYPYAIRPDDVTNTAHQVLVKRNGVEKNHECINLFNNFPPSCVQQNAFYSRRLLD